MKIRRSLLKKILREEVLSPEKEVKAQSLSPDQPENLDQKSTLDSVKMMFSVVKPEAFEMVGVESPDVEKVVERLSDLLDSSGLNSPEKITIIMNFLPRALSDGRIADAFSKGGIAGLSDLIFNQIKVYNENIKREKLDMKITKRKIREMIRGEIRSLIRESEHNVNWDEVREQIRQGVLYNMTILDFLKSYHGPGSKTQVVDINGQLVQAAPINWEEALADSALMPDDTVGDVIDNHPALKKLLDVEGVVDNQLMARKQSHSSREKSSLAKKDDR